MSGVGDKISAAVRGIVERLPRRRCLMSVSDRDGQGPDAKKRGGRRSAASMLISHESQPGK